MTTPTLQQLQLLDLEPSRAEARTYVSRRRLGRIDAATVLATMIGLLLFIPARFIFPGFSDIGRPAIILCLLMFAWWVLVRFTSNHLVLVGRQPLRWAYLVVIVTILISYAIGEMRGLTSAEQSGADNYLLSVAAFVGCGLMVADGIPNWRRLYLVIDALVLFGSFAALFGIVQYVTRFDPTQYIAIPGLVAKGVPPDFQPRGDSLRVASTTTHYIELSTVLATILPFAIHRALFNPKGSRRNAYIAAAGIIVGGVMVTISRTGILALLVVAVVLIPMWSWRVRYNIMVLVVGGLAAFAVLDTGLIKSLTNLFDDPSNNPAFTVRQERYPLAWQYFFQRPWLGRGSGTYVSPQYQFLDNQWLTFLITNGIVGVAAMAAMHITAIVLVVLGIRRSQSKEARHLCAAALAAQVMAIVVAGTYDSWSFASYTTVVAVAVGICGAVWRLTHPARVVRTGAPRWFADRELIGS